MKYTYCERIIWHAMAPAMCRYLQEQHPEWDIPKLKKTAKQRFMEMAERTPDIGGLRKNTHRINLTGGMVWLAFYQAAPQTMTEDDFAGMIRAAISAPPVKATYGMKKGKMFTPAGVLKRKAELERNNAASDDPFNWRAEVILGQDAQAHSVHFHRCGLCALGKQEGAEHLIPYMCDIDYLTYPWMGAALYRTQTLANGGAYCDFYVCKQGSRWDEEKQQEKNNADGVSA